MKLSLLDVLKLILGTAEEIVPVFIHNANSQKIEAIVVGTVNGIVAGLGAPQPGTNTAA